MKIIAFINQKGGVGKTTTAHNAGAALARAGRRVLLVDLDAQSSLTAGCGVEPGELEKTVYDVLDGKTTFQEIITPVQGVQGLALAPAGIDLAQADLAFAGRIGRENLLKKALSALTEYDYVFLDCPPNLGLITLNALVAANSLLIPVQTEFHAMRGLELLQDTIALVRDLNPALSVLGIVATFYDKRKVLNREVYNELRRVFPEILFESRIRDGVSLAEAPSRGQDIFTYKPGSPAAEDYENLARELERRA